MYSVYYLAQVVKSRVWLLTGCLRNMDNLALERTIDKQESILEFFVPSDRNDEFISFMEHLKAEGVVLWVKRAKNRLEP